VLRKRAIAAASVVVGASLLLTAGAQAAPTELTVRIEGATKTLFEGPVLSDGHDIQASSDVAPRHCDGTNGGAHAEPGPTPTSAAVDAMGLIGQTFDGDWYPGYDDYFIERWGPDSQDPGSFAYWGLLVNGVMTSVGGCQWADQAGDEVLWAYDAFSGRSLLKLSAAGDTSMPPDPTASVEVGEPLELSVQTYAGAEGEPPEVTPAEGITVAPVKTGAETGYETVETSSPAAVTTAADGIASVTFGSTGWQRLKAQEDAGFVRSNRLDVCVEPEGGGNCGPLPADAQLRVPARYGTGEPAPGPSAPGGGTTGEVPGAAAPSNAFRLRGGGHDRRKGTATLEAVVPGPGHLVLKGGRVRAVSVDAATAGVVRLKVTPNPAARRSLRRQGKLTVALRVAFTPTGGTTATRTRNATLRLESAAR
jgi:hypothetical protein